MHMTSEMVKAVSIMIRYGVPEEDLQEIFYLLMNAGAEKYIKDQQAAYEDKEEHIKRAYRGPGLVH